MRNRRRLRAVSTAATLAAVPQGLERLSACSSIQDRDSHWLDWSLSDAGGRQNRLVTSGRGIVIPALPELALSSQNDWQKAASSWASQLCCCCQRPMVALRYILGLPWMCNYDSTTENPDPESKNSSPVTAEQFDVVARHVSQAFRTRAFGELARWVTQDDNLKVFPSRLQWQFYDGATRLADAFYVLATRSVEVRPTTTGDKSPPINLLFENRSSDERPHRRDNEYRSRKKWNELIAEISRCLKRFGAAEGQTPYSVFHSAQTHCTAYVLEKRLQALFGLKDTPATATSISAGPGRSAGRVSFGGGHRVADHHPHFRVVDNHSCNRWMLDAGPGCLFGKMNSSQDEETAYWLTPDFSVPGKVGVKVGFSYNGEEIGRAEAMEGFVVFLHALISPLLTEEAVTATWQSLHALPGVVENVDISPFHLKRTNDNFNFELSIGRQKFAFLRITPDPWTNCYKLDVRWTGDGWHTGTHAPDSEVNEGRSVPAAASSSGEVGQLIVGGDTAAEEATPAKLAERQILCTSAKVSVNRLKKMLRGLRPFKASLVDQLENAQKAVEGVGLVPAVSLKDTILSCAVRSIAIRTALAAASTVPWLQTLVSPWEISDQSPSGCLALRLPRSLWSREIPPLASSCAPIGILYTVLSRNSNNESKSTSTQQSPQRQPAQSSASVDTANVVTFKFLGSAQYSKRGDQIAAELTRIVNATFAGASSIGPPPRKRSASDSTGTKGGAPQATTFLADRTTTAGTTVDDVATHDTAYNAAGSHAPALDDPALDDPKSDDDDTTLRENSPNDSSLQDDSHGNFDNNSLNGATAAAYGCPATGLVDLSMLRVSGLIASRPFARAVMERTGCHMSVDVRGGTGLASVVCPQAHMQHFTLSYKVDPGCQMATVGLSSKPNWSCYYQAQQVTKTVQELLNECLETNARCPNVWERTEEQLAQLFQKALKGGPDIRDLRKAKAVLLSKEWGKSERYYHCLLLTTLLGHN